MVAFITFLLKFALFFFIFFLALILWIAYTFYKQIKRTRRQFTPYDQQEGTETKGNTVTDNRPIEKRNKQVIPDSEGEYVDFTEVDDPEPKQQ